MSLKTRKRQIPMEQETVAGVAETLVAADVQFKVSDVSSGFTPETQERDNLRETLSPEGVLIGRKFGEISFTTEVHQYKDSGDAVTTIPPLNDPMIACGHERGTVMQIATAGVTGTFAPGEHITGGSGASGYFLSVSGNNVRYYLKPGAQDFVDTETLTGDDSGATATASAAPTQLGVGYNPTSSSTTPAFTAADRLDGTDLTIFGARGTGTLGAAGVGQVGRLAVTLTGMSTGVVDASLFTGVDLPTILPQTFLSGAVSFKGTAVCIDSFQLDFGNTVSPAICANNATGAKEYEINQRQPTITADPEQDLEANFPAFTDFAGGTLLSFTATIGQTAGTRCQVVAGRCQYSELSRDDRDGAATLGTTMRPTAATDTGDDEYIVAFY